MLKLVAILVLILGIGLVYLASMDSFTGETLRDKRVLITGASSGVGEELAYQYARLGTRILLTDRRQKLLGPVAEKCLKLGAKQVEVIGGDMTSGEHRKKLLKAAERRFGGLDHLILNHAELYVASWAGSQQNMTSLEHMMNVNFYSYVDTVSLALGLLRKSQGCVGVVSSLDGKVPRPLLAAEAASRAAQQNFFSSLRMELQNDGESQVSISVLVLGFVGTEEALDLTQKYFPTYRSFLAASPEGAARAIVQGVELRKSDVYYPRMAWAQYVLYKILPEVYEYNFNDLSSFA